MERRGRERERGGASEKMVIGRERRGGGTDRGMNGWREGGSE
jgi:hypothetical protein